MGYLGALRLAASIGKEKDIMRLCLDYEMGVSRIGHRKSTNMFVAHDS
jgi:hypothetical protein